MNDDGDGDDDLLLSSLSFAALNIHTNLFKLPLYYNFGILFSAFSSHSVDVTGESVGLDPKGDDSLAEEISVSAVSLVLSMATLNPAFGSLGGDPFVDDNMKYVHV